jgi:OmcA/MtrC family decaheme c-type cytochrome
MLPGTVLEILAVDNAAPGKQPIVTFSVKDKSGKPIQLAGMRLSIVLAGPTSDYSTYVSEDVTKSTGPGDGRYFYTFQKPIPADAKGTFTMGIEGYRSVTLLQGTKKEMTVRDAGVNKTFSFSVDGSPVEQRREIVSLAKCNGCHSNFSLHGDNRNTIEQCVLCHNPNADDSPYRPANLMPAESIDMRHMIHKIHTGEEIGKPYVIIGRGGSLNDFGEVRYPGDRRNCSACHVNGSEQPPLNENLLPVKSPRGLLNPMGPVTAACTGCHTGIAASSHALSNTTEKLGEACAACHATDYAFGVPKVHAR